MDSHRSLQLRVIGLVLLAWIAFPSGAFGASEMTIAIGSSEVKSGEFVTVQVEASLVTSNLAGATIEVSYDSSVLDVVECVPDPDGLFDASFCNPEFDTDGDDHRVRFNMASTQGIEGDATLATITFRAVGSGGESSALDVFTELAVDRNGDMLTVAEESGSVTISARPGEETDDSGSSISPAWLLLLLIPIGVGLAVTARHFAGRLRSGSA